jgi:hypothetical protein
MARKITYLAPCKARKGRTITHEERTGEPIMLPLGDRKVRFVIQDGAFAPEMKALVHRASGYRVGDLDPVKVRAMLAYGHAHHLTNRAAASQLLREAVAKLGADHVQRVIDAAPVINPSKGAK